MKLYRIKDWDEHYENSRSRQVKDLDWVPIPNRHDGEGYSLIMAHPRGSEIFAAWVLMLQVASRCQPRGSLVRDTGSPHSSISLALKTRAKREWFDIALEFLCTPDVAWMESSEVSDCDQLALGRQADVTPTSPACQSGDEEGKGREGKGKNGIEGKSEGNTPTAPDSTSKRFQKPTFEEVKLAAAKVGLPFAEAEKFWNHYEANGWHVGRHKMKSLPHALANWKKNWEEWRRPGQAAPAPKRDLHDPANLSEVLK